MTAKIITYILIIASSFIVGLYVSNTDTEYIPTGDTLKIGVTTFQLDSITKKLYAQLDTFTKPLPIIKWKTRWDTITGDTILVFPNDTIYPANFYLEDLYVRITGTTYYSLHNSNTFDISYDLKSRNLMLNTFFTNGKIENSLSENGVIVPFKSKTDYSEYYNYIESLKTPMYLKWYVTIPATILGMSGIIYLVK